MRSLSLPLIVLCAAVAIAGCAKQTTQSSTTTTEVTSPPSTSADAGATPVALVSPAASPADAASPGAVTSPASVASPGSAASPAATVAFTDISGNLAEKAIVTLGRAGALDATTGTFSPQKPILRREFARWLYKTNNVVWADVPGKQIHPAETGDKSDFADLPTTDPDFAIIEGLSESGISVGFPDKSFKPDQPLTHEQGIAIKAMLDRGGIADRYKNQAAATLGIPDWKDKAQISKTFVGAIATDHSADEIDSVKIDNVGRTFGAVAMFRPQAPFTRAQAAMLLQVYGAHTQDTNRPNEPRMLATVLDASASPSPAH